MGATYDRAREVIRLTLAGPDAGPLVACYIAEDIADALRDAGLLAADDDLTEFEQARAASRANVPQLAALARGHALGTVVANEVLDRLNRSDGPT